MNSTNLALDAHVIELDTSPPTAFQSLPAFCRHYVPLSYAIEPIIRSSSLYTLTARTGHGKTGFLVAASFAVAVGREDILGRPVEGGRVAYIAAENPDDIRMRMMVTAFRHNIAFADLGKQIVVLDKRMTPEEAQRELILEAERRGPFSMVVGDTLAAMFDGRDINDNVQLGQFVRRLRAWTTVPGLPSAVIAAHPIKGASRDQLIPYGGGAALNEVDGNLAMWMDGGTAELFSQGKFRGPDFDAIPFRFEVLGSPDVLDAKGRQVQIPVCVPVARESVEARAAESGNRNLAVLRALEENPNASQRELGSIVGIRSVSTVAGAIASLARKGFVEQGANEKWRTTPKGRRELSEPRT